MNTRKLTPVLMSLLLVIALSAGCVLPEYQMSFDVLSETQGVAGADVIVGYEMENIGRDNLSNALIVITVDTNTGSYNTVVTAGTLSVGERRAGSVNIPVSGTYISGSARITSAGWDVESN